METAIGAATWLIGKVLDKLSNDLVAAYVASSELGLNSNKIKSDLNYTHALLHEARGRDHNNPSLKLMLEQLSEEANEAEDILDKFHYFIIQDQLDGTHHATPDLGGDLHEKVEHGRNAVRHTIGNWLSCFTTCCRTKGDAACAATATATVTADNPHNKSKPESGSGHVDKLTFDRVAMSTKIKSVIEAIHSRCVSVSDLLKISSYSSTTGTTTITLNRPVIGSIVIQDKLYGRAVIFQETIKNITSASETLSVLPIVGPGGIGKTTFTQHLYDDKKTKEHFTVRVWVCVSTEFDVLKLTQEIHRCIPATEEKESNVDNGTTNLDQLQISIACRLRSKRFLIVLDDVWKCDSDDEWKTLLAPFTKGEARGNMVLVTTRFPKIENMVKKATISVNLRGLDPKEFLEFFQICVFGENKPDSQYDELIEIGKEIAAKLKYSPLAAKTVARLLKKDLRWKHWMNVLENSEWKNQTHTDDIMPALKISYDYLSFHLKQYFSYFSLFPEDRMFTNIEITRFCTVRGIIDPSCKNNNYLEELVENGFLVKEVGNDLEDQRYKMHDLMHELSRNVSSQECVNISSLSFSADDIPQSIQHMSITIQNKYDENFMKEMGKLKSRIKMKNLRTLMIFREYEERISEIFKNTFDEIEGLRVLFIVMNSSESLPKNFSKLLHLRYLKISSPDPTEISLPSTLPRFYHLIFLDLKEWNGSSELPEHFSRLVNLSHLIAYNYIHSNVSEVGKIEHLEELKEFHVKKRSVGFELEELGKLTDLGGVLSVCNLQEVVTKAEANRAKLVLKRNLKTLELIWGRKQSCIDGDVVEGLRPHDNLRELAIIDYDASIGPPSWLFRDVPMKHLEKLTLKGVSWGILPPFELLPCLETLQLQSIGGVRVVGPDLGTMHIKEVWLVDMLDLEEWVVGPNCQSFPVLESIECHRCPKLQTLPFWSEYLSGGLGCTQDDDIRYPSLGKFVIDGCCMLSLPPMPHMSTLTYAKVSDNDPVTGSTSTSFILRDDGHELLLSGYSGAFALHNMGKVERIYFRNGSAIPWTDLRKPTSLRELRISNDPTIQSMALLSDLTSLTSLSLIHCNNLTMNGFNPLIILNLKSLTVYNDRENGSYCRSIAADLLSEVAIYCMRSSRPVGASALLQLEYLDVDSISGVLVSPICSLLSSTLRTLVFTHGCERVKGLNEEEEKALQLLTFLRQLWFYECTALTSLPQGLHTLASLEVLHVLDCPEIRSLPLLPASLLVLRIYNYSVELEEQAEVLKQQAGAGAGGTNPHLEVDIFPRMAYI